VIDLRNSLPYRWIKLGCFNNSSITADSFPSGKDPLFFKSYGFLASELPPSHLLMISQTNKN
jgi:hypothetical protein